MATERKPTPTERLVAAMDRCAVARGEAQWTHGYRTGASRQHAPTEDARLYEKEQRQWKRAGEEERKFRRLAQRLLREARNAR